MKLLTTAEAADRLAVSARTLRREIAAGKLPTVRIGRLVRIRFADVEAYITASLRRETPGCRFENVVELGKYAAKSAEQRLDALLASGPPKRTRKSSRRASSATP